MTKARTYLKLTLLLLVVGVSPPLVRGAQQTSNKRSETPYQNGLAHYESGRYKEAVDAFARAIRLRPVSDSSAAAVHYYMGMAYMQLGQHLEALKYLKEAVRLKPAAANARAQLGAMHNYFGEYGEAIRHLDQAVRLAPGDAASYEKLGAAYHRTGRPTEAVEAFKQAIRLAPNVAATYLNLSKAYQELGRYAEAGEAREQARRLATRSAPGAGAQSMDAPSPKAQAGDGARVGLRESKISGRDDEPVLNGASGFILGEVISQDAARTQNPAQNPGAQVRPSPVMTSPNTSSAPRPDISLVKRNASSTAETATGKGSGPTTDAAAQAALTNIYRVGAGDVLDIRLLNTPAPSGRESTSFTVLPGGLLEYPLAGDSLIVAGMTSDEIGARLASELKRRAVYDRPQVLVSVREYLSHTILVSGLVSEPGSKVIRREAVPLYVVIADAQPRAEAGRVLIARYATNQSTHVDLADAEAMNTLVRPGDVLNVQARPPQFFYIGGEIKEPGEKLYRAGLTLTQAILIAGGASPSAGGTVKVARQSADGLLVMSRYNLKEIESGKAPDPRLQPGDRVEVIR